MCYFTPYPELKMYRSMKELIYCERSFDWENFDYKSGTKIDGHEEPSFKKYGGDPDWKDDELEKTKNEITKQMENRRKLFEKKESKNFKFDKSKTGNTCELLYFTKGEFSGKFPSCPDWPIKILPASPDSSSSKCLVKDKEGAVEICTLDSDEDEMFSDDENENSSGQSSSTSDCFIVSSNSNFTELVNNSKSLTQEELESNEKSIEEAKKNPNPYMAIDAASVWNVLVSSVGINISEERFHDNIDLLERCSQLCDPHKDPRWGFIYRKDELLTEEDKIKRQEFFENFIADKEFKIWTL